ncbi:hypothetical protein BDZ89DRAFT_143312 [Hymenopellis radicata]|nr:hypothetical protein BDZ89DRAFT_143312 [Hymenopellis radicata]
MSRRYGTRGVKVNIDPSLLKSTRAELNEARKKKQDEEADAKRIQDEAAEAEKAKARRGRRRVGAALDAQVNADQSFHSLRPDLVVAESIAQTEDKPTPAAVQPLQPSTTSNSLTSAPSHDEEGIPRDDVPDEGGPMAESSMDIEEEPYYDPLLLPTMPPETESEGSLYAGDIDMGGTSSEPNDKDGEDDDDDGPSGPPLNPNYDSDASDAYEDDGVDEDSEDEMQEDDELDGKKKGKGKQVRLPKRLLLRSVRRQVLKRRSKKQLRDVTSTPIAPCQPKHRLSLSPLGRNARTWPLSLGRTLNKPNAARRTRLAVYRRIGGRPSTNNNLRLPCPRLP